MYFFFILILQLEECAIQLWNWAVTKNVGNTISKTQKAKGTLRVAVFIYMIILQMIKNFSDISEMLTQRRACKQGWSRSVTSHSYDLKSSQCAMSHAVCCTVVSLRIQQRASSASKSW